MTLEIVVKEEEIFAPTPLDAVAVEIVSVEQTIVAPLSSTDLSVSVAETAFLLQPREEKIEVTQQLEQVSVQQGCQGDQGPQGVAGATGQPGAPGIVWRGDYNGSTVYSPSNVVRQLGITYIHVGVTTTIGAAPPNGAYWEVLVSSDSADKHYSHTQSVASDVWTATHNLTKFPAVSIVDTGGSIVEGEVEYLSLSTVQITFSSPFTGKAYFN